MTKSKKLRQLLDSQPIIRAMGAHNGLGAKLIERNHFDAVWASGLEISTSHVVPDANILTMTDNLAAAQAINEATNLPVICDCDTGYGNASNVKYMIKKYETAGLAAAVIEDKLFPKVNSFIPGRQELASIEEFSGKIEAAKSAQKDPDFMVFARVEALIAGWGMHEALERARAYTDAGADGIVIHSKSQTPNEIFTFAQEWKRRAPLVVIPTTYYRVTMEELASHGIQIVIYANHGLRAAFSAMNSVFKTIHDMGSTAPVEEKIASMKEIFEIQGMLDIKEDEKKFIKKERIHAIIPAAKDHCSQPDLEWLLKDKPLCMLSIGKKTLLERQIDLLRKEGISDISVVGGYLHDKIKAENVEVIYNADYSSHHSAYSIMNAKDYFKKKTLVLYSDILFDRHILKRLLESPYPITLVIDRAYQTLPPREKQLDLVIAPQGLQSQGARNLNLNTYKKIQRIGKNLPKDKVNYEFIGLVFFRDKAGEELLQAWEEACEKFKNLPFYESPNVAQASFTDLIQHLIDKNYPVYGMEVEHGWSEIHSLEDYERVNAYFKDLDDNT